MIEPGPTDDYEPTPAMINAGADVARELVEYEWAVNSADDQTRILTAIYRAMERQRICP